MGHGKGEKRSDLRQTSERKSLYHIIPIWNKKIMLPPNPLCPNPYLHPEPKPKPKQKKKKKNAILAPQDINQGKSCSAVHFQRNQGGQLKYWCYVVLITSTMVMVIGVDVMWDACNSSEDHRQSSRTWSRATTVMTSNAGDALGLGLSPTVLVIDDRTPSMQVRCRNWL